MSDYTYRLTNIADGVAYIVGPGSQTIGEVRRTRQRGERAWEAVVQIDGDTARYANGYAPTRGAAVDRAWRAAHRMPETRWHLMGADAYIAISDELTGDDALPLSELITDDAEGWARMTGMAWPPADLDTVLAAKRANPYA